MTDTSAPVTPLLLFDGECAVCRAIARWVETSARDRSGQPSIQEQPIGDSPDALRALNPNLDIWDAYATIHVLMPDGSMRLGGDAVAVVLRSVPITAWFTPLFDIRVFGFRPFAALLNLGYTILADVRPLLGCESCGTPARWLQPLVWMTGVVSGRSRTTQKPAHFTATAKR